MATIDLTTDEASRDGLEAMSGDGLEAMSVKALKAEAASRGASFNKSKTPCTKRSNQSLPVQGMGEVGTEVRQ